VSAGGRRTSGPGAHGASGRSGLEIEVLGRELAGGGAPACEELERLCAIALGSLGIGDGHVAIEFVDAERIHELNRRHRGVDRPTDVLSFGVDERSEPWGPRELGDIVICAEHTRDLREAVVHGALHLAGMDHECDEGEMLALQDQLLRSS
jgi:probable rRNA maturation factor